MKMEDKASLEAVKSFLDHLKSMIADEDLMGDKPVEIEVTSIEPVDGEDMEEVVEKELELPEVEDKVDDGEELEDEVEEDAEDVLDPDLEKFFRRG